jgi:hypothetical protein
MAGGYNADPVGGCRCAFGPGLDELRVDLIVLGYQHYRASGVAEHVIQARPHCSILLGRPPD